MIFMEISLRTWKKLMLRINVMDTGLSAVLIFRILFRGRYSYFLKISR